MPFKGQGIAERWRQQGVDDDEDTLEEFLEVPIE